MLYLEVLRLGLEITHVRRWLKKMTVLPVLVQIIAGVASLILHGGMKWQKNTVCLQLTLGYN
jgi:hypothetical protein